MRGYRHSGFLAMVISSSASLGICQSGQEKPKPSQCEGTLMINAVVPDIQGVNNAPFSQFVGNLTYSLSMAGNFTLNSTVASWHCSTIQTESQSTSAMRSLKNVYTSAQMACQADQVDIDSPWVTKWNHITFGGRVYVSVIAHNGICASSPTLLDNGSPCNYNATTDGGLTGHGDCKWEAKDDPKLLGEAEAEAEQAEQSEGGGGQ